MTIDKIESIFDNNLISGSIAKVEGLFLYNLARGCEKGVIVEIGSANGLSTVCLGLGSKDGHGVKVYSIDPHIPGGYTPDPEWIECQDVCKDGMPDKKYYVGQGTGHLEFYDNIEKWRVGDIVIPIVDYSESAYINYDDGSDKYKTRKGWDHDIGLLFIDGDHRLNYVKKDIELWAKHVIDGGKVLFHDYPFPGVSKTINELIIGNKDNRYCNFRGVGIDPIVNVTVRDNNDKDERE